MSDISKCVGANCPLRNNCYRYTASTDGVYQMWGDFQCINGKCDYYWKNK